MTRPEGSPRGRAARSCKRVDKKHAGSKRKIGQTTQSIRSSARIATRNIYAKLETSKRQIRVLRILDCSSTTGNDYDLECSLTTISLDHDIQYDALSYAWGDPSVCPPIRVNGISMSITTNLYTALMTFRKDHSVPGYLWVDAICINQSDKAERSKQVAMMGDIYRQAEIVHIWLGLAGPHTDEAFNTLERLALDKMAIDVSQMEETLIHGLYDIAERTWWRRIWVIQEAVLARRSVVHSGGAAMTFRNMIASLYSIWKHCRSMNEHGDLARSLDKAMPSFARIEDFSSSDPSSIAGILQAIEAANFGQASNRRDRIYGLLGFLPRSINIEPDYTASVEEVYTASAMKIMVWSQSLSLLQYASAQRNPGTPTWTLDFSDLPVQVADDRFHASRDLRALIEQRSCGELAIHALIVDEVRCTSGQIPYLSWSKADDPDVIESFRVRLHGLRDLATESDGGSFSRAIEDRFWRTIVNDRIVDIWNLHNGSSCHPYSPDTLGVAELDRWLTGVEPAIDTNILDRLRWSIEEDANFYRTRSDRFGNSMGNVREGDSIAILAGSIYPFILRTVDKGRRNCYEVVGPCYCDGIMYGEAVPAAVDSDEDGSALDYGFKEIVLI